MSGHWCRTCGEFAYARHSCPPAWLVWAPEADETVCVRLADDENAPVETYRVSGESVPECHARAVEVTP